MVTNPGSKGQKLAELNLVPFIDILSTCICFLLMTTIWIHIGTMDIKQAVGEQTLSGGDNPPSLSLMLDADGSVEFALKDVENPPQELSQSKFPARGGQIDWTAVESYLDSLTSQLPQVKTVLIMPAAKSNYEDLIRLMDQVRVREIKDIGISPL